jgi:hypothetical protein
MMIAIGVVVLAVAAVAVFLLTERPSPGSAQAAPHSAPLSSSQAHEVAVALGRLVTNPDSLVASTSRGQVGGHAKPAVPAGSTVAVDEASWAPDGAGGGVIAVTVRSPGRPPTTYAAVMVLEAGQWKVVATEPIADSTPTGGPTG